MPQNVSEDIIKSIINNLEWLPFIYICGSISYDLRVTITDNIFSFVMHFFGYGVTSMSLFLSFLGYLLFFKKKLPKR
jgi:hypothetical protein